MESAIENDVKAMSPEEHASSVLPPATGSTKINLATGERVISVLGGAALSVYGLRNIKSPSGIGMLLGGTFLLVRGISGYCAISQALHRNTANKKPSAMEVTTTLLINRPRYEVYAYWRTLGNLPRFMKHLKEVTEVDDRRSRWAAEIPGGLGSVSWEAEITEDISGEIIAWRSLPGSTIDNAGEVKFKDAPGNKGTEVRATISYRLPAGELGSLAGKLFNPAVKQMIMDDLRRFKRILETGESPVSERTTNTETPAGSFEGHVLQGS
jgi:uncharacterized membrane protein